MKNSMKAWCAGVWAFGAMCAASGTAPAAAPSELAAQRPWTAKRISGEPRELWRDGVSHIRKTFDVREGLTRATLVTTGMGAYLVRVNGRNAAPDRLFLPTDTEQTVRTEFDAREVAGLLRTGENRLDFDLSLGWMYAKRYHNGSMAKRIAYVSAQLDLEYADGARETILTDGSEKCTRTSPIREAGIYNGCVYDARLEGREPCDWLPVHVEADDVVVSPPLGPFIRELAVERYVAASSPAPGTWVLDFGTNGAGVEKLALSDMPEGVRLVLSCAEILKDDGTVNLDPMRSAKSRDVYITKKGENRWAPPLTFHGFRYVQVEGWPFGRPPSKDEIFRALTGSDVRRDSFFRCSDPLVQELYEAMVRTQGANLHDKPVDCPQRDERLGWLGGGNFAMEALIYERDAHAFLRKWLRDILDTQMKDSGLFLYGQAPGISVGSSLPMFYAPFSVVKKLLDYYEDRDALAAAFPALRRHYHALLTFEQGALLRYADAYYGDWLAAEHSDIDQIEQVYWLLMSQTYAALATAAGEPREAELATAKAHATAEAYNRRYWKPKAALYGFPHQSQASLALPLHFGLVPAGFEARVFSNLVQRIEKARGEVTLTGGYTSMPVILETLLENGRRDLILAAFRKRTYPSWGFMLAQGATTLWERWENIITREMNCHNQYAQSASIPFFYRAIAGVSWPTREDGVMTFELRPFAGRPAQVSARLATPWGALDVEETPETVTVTVPAGCRLRCDGRLLPAGRHELRTARADSLPRSEARTKDEDGPKIIFDTDMYTDFDDVGALAVLHALADAGACEILGTVVSTRKAPSTGMVELINGFYGRGDLPIGAPRGLGLGPDVDPDALKNASYKIYAETVSAHPELRFPTGDAAPDANEVYRRLLSAAPDGSVTVVTVGFTTNLRRLLETKADAFSPLDGRALVAKKVKAWYAMACKHPDGFEYNSGADGASSKIVFAEWPTPVYFLDVTYGFAVKCGVPVSKRGEAVNPVRDVFRRALRDYGEAETGHPAWDQITVLAAVRGVEPLFGSERGTFEIIDEKGRNRWTKSASGNHCVLTEKTPKAEIARLIDDLMSKGPCSRVVGEL